MPSCEWQGYLGAGHPSYRLPPPGLYLPVSNKVVWTYEILRLHQAWAVAEKEGGRMKMTDGEKLRILAIWIDSKFPNDLDPEVQNDLRRIADKLDIIDAEGTT